MSTHRENRSVVPLDGHHRAEDWACVPRRPAKNPARRRYQPLNRSRGNCFFAPGVPSGVIDFCYRAAVKLKLRNRKLFFMRGALRGNGRLLFRAVALRELDWGTGTSVVIPRRLRYRDTGTFIIENRAYEIRTMELLFLQGLLRLAFPREDRSWYACRSADILARGWKTLDNPVPPEVIFKSEQR